MNSIEKLIDQRKEELQDSTLHMSRREILEAASNERLWAKGSSSGEECAVHTINAEAYAALAEERAPKYRVDADLEGPGMEKITVLSSPTFETEGEARDWAADVQYVPLPKGMQLTMVIVAVDQDGEAIEDVDNL